MTENKQFEALKKAIKESSPEFHDLIAPDLEASKIYKDPFMLASYIYKLAKEREQYNKQLLQLNEKVDKVLERLDSPSTNSLPPSTDANTKLSFHSPHSLNLLPLHDQKIISFVSHQKAVTAEQVRMEMNYKGKNAASARLNLLFNKGLLQKTRSGKTVYFTLNPQKPQKQD